MSGSHLSKDFFDLVKAIGESKSKQEEDRIIVNEVRTLKQRFQEKNLSKKVIKESLVRLIYVEMLGHDASFAYVHAIQLTAAGDLMQKKVGYLCASLTLSPDHEFRFMLVNQLQRDLASANILEVSTALIALQKLITPEMVPALLPSVQKLLTHDQSTVRKKAVLAIYRIYQLDPGAVDHLLDTFRRVLCDKDPAVMGASLCLLHELARENPASQKDLVSSYTSILKQIVEHRLAKDFDYHRIPAPWIQIKLLKILAILGQNDKRASEEMYDVIHDCMKRANTGIYVGYAIVYECVHTVTAIYPNPVLLDAAAGAIARFIQSDSHNLKYLGVTGLAAVVRDHPRYAAEHQMVVLDCLEDPDETLKRKTLDLLFRMTNPVNAEVVVDKLVFFLKGAVDKFLRQDLVTRICQLAERFAPSNIWYIRTVAKVFELGGELVEEEVAHNLLRLLAEGVGDDEVGQDGEDADEAMRREACEIFYDMFEKALLPDILLRVMFWALGEYAYLMGVDSLPEVLEVLCEAAGRQGMAPDTRGYGVSAVMKICAQLSRLPAEAAELIDKYSASLDVDLQQRCIEFRELARNPSTLAEVLPVDASCEDLSEPDFSFLDGLVEQARATGATEYSPPSQSENDEFEYDDDDLENRAQRAKAEPALKYDAYAKPEPPPSHFNLSNDAGASLDYGDSSGGGGNNHSSGGAGAIGASGGLNGAGAQGGLNLRGVKSVWGSSGYGGAGPGAGVSSVPSSSGVAAALEAASVAATASASASGSKSTSNLPEYMLPSAEAKEESPTVATRPPAPVAKPRELSEREKMAAALFGGVGPGSGDGTGGSSSSSSSATSAGRTRRRAPGQLSTGTTEPPAAAPTVTSPVNLLDFGDDDDDSNINLGGSSGQDVDVGGLSSDFDLLSALDTPAPVGSHEAHGGGGQGLDDLLGGSNPAPPPLPYDGSPMNTQEFGQKWVAHAMEARLAVAMHSIGSIDDLVARVQAQLGVVAAEVIAQTEEAIFAGTEKSTGALLLLHGKKSHIGADFIVRSGSADVTARAKQRCQQLK